MANENKTKQTKLDVAEKLLLKTIDDVEGCECFHGTPVGFSDCALLIADIDRAWHTCRENLNQDTIVYDTNADGLRIGITSFELQSTIVGGGQFNQIREIDGATDGLYSVQDITVDIGSATRANTVEFGLRARRMDASVFAKMNANVGLSTSLLFQHNDGTWYVSVAKGLILSQILRDSRNNYDQLIWSGDLKGYFMPLTDPTFITTTLPTLLA